MSGKASVSLKSWAFPGEFPTRNIAGNGRDFQKEKKKYIPTGYTPI